LRKEVIKRVQTQALQDKNSQKNREVVVVGIKVVGGFKGDINRDLNDFTS